MSSTMHKIRISCTSLLALSPWQSFINQAHAKKTNIWQTQIICKQTHTCASIQVLAGLIVRVLAVSYPFVQPPPLPPHRSACPHSGPPLSLAPTLSWTRSQGNELMTHRCLLHLTYGCSTGWWSGSIRTSLSLTSSSRMNFAQQLNTRQIDLRNSMQKDRFHGLPINWLHQELHLRPLFPTTRHAASSPVTCSGRRESWGIMNETTPAHPTSSKR